MSDALVGIADPDFPRRIDADTSDAVEEVVRISLDPPESKDFPERQRPVWGVVEYESHAGAIAFSHIGCGRRIHGARRDSGEQNSADHR